MPGDTLKQGLACKLQENNPLQTPQNVENPWENTVSRHSKKKTDREILRLFETLQKRWKTKVSEQAGSYVTSEEAMWTPAARPAITVTHR